jgi:ATP-dependent Lhr-like helicase
MNWTELRPIQSESIRAILQTEDDIIVSAATASGKTEAAFLPIISHIDSNRRNSIQALCISPLKALINDQFRRLDDLSEYAEIPVHRWHGDVGQDKKAKLVKNPGGVLLLTPESLESLFINRTSALERMFANLEFVVIDELHAFVGRERGTHMKSLLKRLEQRIKHSYRIVALSATLGDWPKKYAEWLRPKSPDSVLIIEDKAASRTVRLKIYGYPNEHLRKSTAADGNQDQATDLEVEFAEVLSDLQVCFNGRHGLIFANSRNNVEWFADALNHRNEADGLPRSYLVHHGSVSKHVREETEDLMRGEIPFTTLCSSSLELGIDIGDVQIVGQLGAPWSVNSLIQRLGRSGRRGDRGSEIRIFITELPGPKKDAELIDRLHIELIQAIALVELMLEKWLEPPEIAPFDPSTFVQQIMSVLAETGGIRASAIYSRLVESGTFADFTKSQFASILRSLHDHGIVQQMDEGDLILGLKGEQIVKSFEFYSAFMSAKELKVVHGGKHVGSISGLMPPQESDHILLAGRRWQVVHVDDRTSTIEVTPAKGRKAAKFNPSGGFIDDKVFEKMRQVLLSDKSYAYLSNGAAIWLCEARAAATEANLGTRSWIELTPQTCLLFPWCGTRTMITIGLLARSIGLACTNRDGIAIEFKNGFADVRARLRDLVKYEPTPHNIAEHASNHAFRKYDEFLPNDIVENSFISNVMNFRRAIEILEMI